MKCTSESDHAAFIMLLALLHKPLKESFIEPVILTGIEDIPMFNDYPKWTIEPKVYVPEFITVKEPFIKRNKKGKSIVDTTPFYNKFAKAKHERRSK